MNTFIVAAVLVAVLSVASASLFDDDDGFIIGAGGHFGGGHLGGGHFGGHMQGGYPIVKGSGLPCKKHYGHGGYVKGGMITKGYPTVYTTGGQYGGSQMYGAGQYGGSQMYGAGQYRGSQMYGAGQFGGSQLYSGGQYNAGAGQYSGGQQTYASGQQYYPSQTIY
ncbi:glycine-rich cell wall structural protein-like [Mizuhopecten yessoensis]|uniref:Uncharacterized protein n=1 Tax=Mizuhopecten yessoensis TaxID=6573 RepID=A0A210PGN7_MIZYE|nr:glycine-rich cell wall structural protein-like [Mizuhopecten yessoensis]OWF35662.1 hypothetical protein KP79_PYT09733 [Mizuhopecten yessoensis]